MTRALATLHSFGYPTGSRTHPCFGHSLKGRGLWIRLTCQSAESQMYIAQERELAKTEPIAGFSGCISGSVG